MIDMNKKYRTRDGREVRIYATDGETQWPTHGAIWTDDGWMCTCWKVDGTHRKNSEPCSEDLIEVKPERWYPIYADGDHFRMSAFALSTKKEAMQACTEIKGPIDAWKAPE